MDLLSYFKKISKRKIHYFILALAILFLVLTAIVYFIPTTILDYEFSEEVQEHSYPFLNQLMLAISWFGSTWIAVTMVPITALGWLLFSYKKEAILVCLTSTIWGITLGIKILVDRPRPTTDFVNVLVTAQHQSFPSGHTSFYVTFFGFLVFLMLYLQSIPKWIRYLVIGFSSFLIFSVPFSRVYLGAHWLTDVSAGFVLGLLVLYALIRIYLRIK